MRTIQQILESYYDEARVYDKKEEELFRYKAAYDFETFFQHIIGHQVGDYHREIFNLLKNERCAMMSPRGHAKTEICSVCYTLWRGMNKGDLEIVIVSSAEFQSLRVIRRIKNYVDGNEMLQEVKPKNAKTYWSKSEINLKNNTRILTNPFTDTIKGDRIDVCVCDDLLRRELSEQNIAIDKFFEIIVPAVDNPNSQLIVVGTPQSEWDLFHRLAEKGSGFAFKRFQCCKSVDGNKLVGPVLFPERWNITKLQEQLNNMGRTAFMQEYFCIPIQPGEVLFDYDTVIKPCINENMVEYGEAEPNKSYYLGVDVALSKDRAADFSAFVIVEKTTSKDTLKIVKAERPSKGTGTNELFNRIKELHGLFKFQQILIENRGNSMTLVEFLQKDVETAGITEDFKTVNTEKERIILKLQKLMSTNLVEMYHSTILINELMDMGLKVRMRGGRAVEKMESLRGRDDMVMACCLAVESATSKLGQVSFQWV